MKCDKCGSIWKVVRLGYIYRGHHILCEKCRIEIAEDIMKQYRKEEENDERNKF